MFIMQLESYSYLALGIVDERSNHYASMSILKATLYSLKSVVYSSYY